MKLAVYIGIYYTYIDYGFRPFQSSEYINKTSLLIRNYYCSDYCWGLNDSSKDKFTNTIGIYNVSTISTIYKKYINQVILWPMFDQILWIPTFDLIVWLNCNYLLYYYINHHFTNIRIINRICPWMISYNNILYTRCFTELLKVIKN